MKGMSLQLVRVEKISTTNKVKEIYTTTASNSKRNGKNMKNKKEKLLKM